MPLPFGGFFLSLFGNIIARRVADKIAAPVERATLPVKGSRTLAYADSKIIIGLLLAVASPLAGYDWTQLVGPVWGGLFLALLGVTTGVLRVITDGPAKS